MFKAARVGKHCICHLQGECVWSFRKSRVEQAVDGEWGAKDLVG
jgi:hypothetical protein